MRKGRRPQLSTNRGAIVAPAQPATAKAETTSEICSVLSARSALMEACGAFTTPTARPYCAAPALPSKAQTASAGVMRAAPALAEPPPAALLSESPARRESDMAAGRSVGCRGRGSALRDGAPSGLKQRKSHFAVS
jgi:hypothetical protein